MTSDTIGRNGRASHGLGKDGRAMDDVKLRHRKLMGIAGTENEIRVGV